VRKITNYEIVSEISTKELSIAVNGYMFKGWQPFGGPFVDPLLEESDDPESISFCQAIVQYED
jgi:hypothetical protein